MDSTHRDRAELALDVADEVTRDTSREEASRYANATLITLQGLVHAVLAVDDTLRSIDRSQ